ncbi:hypothetical protein A8B79_10515 [Balneola sp. EhC07]|nr:hypothetical protein A8B79_10515 [Balneola sp. EhC07]
MIQIFATQLVLTNALHGFVLLIATRWMKPEKFTSKSKTASNAELVCMPVIRVLWIGIFQILKLAVA